MARRKCATCLVLLQAHHFGALTAYLCPRCGGCLINASAVRKAIRRDIKAQLLTEVRSSKTAGARPCPTCAVAMTVVEVPRGPSPVALDVCYHCGVVWFDAREYQVLREAYGKEEPPPKYVDHQWKWALALLGMPVEQRSLPLLNRPWLTLALAGIVSLVSIVGWGAPALLSACALLPSEIWRLGGLTLLTSFFLHAGLFHLASNMYFLIVFGAAVEDYLGRGRYLLLLLIATLAGDILHVALDPNSTRLLVGASGGISGLVVFYGLQFPHVRLMVLARWFFFYPVRLRAWVALLIWLCLQVIGAVAQLESLISISSIAHFGGAVAGLVFWLRWRNRLDVSVKPASAAAAAGK